MGFHSVTVSYNAVICDLLPKGPPFQHATITLKDAPDELHELYFRDIVACAALLFSNPDYWEEMDYEPEELFVTNEDGSPSTNCVYAELSSGWIWNEEQKKRGYVISIPSHRLPLTLIPPVYLRSFFTNLGAPVFCNHLGTPRWSPPPPFNLLPTPP
ncbi:uncharacterized protein EI90DRAFT_3124588 [Cantharellus anzutake]|uniref:uncharacterized protein n=1 Tax=Cantharellus anzutake TaxID=1750568 RepID=UPI001908EC81|nr:uncharacterized protein EI90DRAFT_3124588 [Cantharellus anzutake]KAF8330156.1 hypothetical protein EI90DRAFT_3124588 [Cantharellus anzutake]